MGRLVILVALVLFAAHASARLNPEQEKSRCERELEDVNLSPCERHIMQRIQSFEGGEEEEDNVLRMRGMKNRHHHSNMRNPFFHSENHKKCCNELSDLEDKPQCMCEALQQIMESQSEEVEGKKQIKRLEKELWNLPESCEMSTPRACELRWDKN